MSTHAEHEVPLDTMLKLRAQQKKLEEEMALELVYLDHLGVADRKRAAKRPTSATHPRGSLSSRGGMADPARGIYLHDGYASSSTRRSSSSSSSRPSAAPRRKPAGAGPSPAGGQEEPRLGTMGSHVDIKDMQAMIERERLLLAMLSEKAPPAPPTQEPARATANNKPDNTQHKLGKRELEAKGGKHMVRSEQEGRIRLLEAHVKDLEARLKGAKRPTKTEEDVRVANERCLALEKLIAEERGVREAGEAQRAKQEARNLKQIKLLAAKNEILEKDWEHQRERGRQEGEEERKAEREEHASRQAALDEDLRRVRAHAGLLEEHVESLKASLRRSERSVETARETIAKQSHQGGEIASNMQERLKKEKEEKDRVLRDLSEASKREAKLLVQLREARERAMRAEEALVHSEKVDQRLTIEALHKKLSAMNTANEALRNELSSSSSRPRPSPSKRIPTSTAADVGGVAGSEDPALLQSLRNDLSVLRSQVAVSKGSCARLEAENEALRGGRMTVTPTAQRAMSRQSKAGPQGQGLKMSVSSSGGKLAMSPAKQGVTGGIVPPGGKEARPKVAKAVLPEVPETPPHARGHASGNEGNAEAHTDTSPLPLGHADAPGGGGSPTPSGEGYADLSVSINEGDAAMQSPAKTYGGHLSPLPSVSPSLSYNEAFSPAQAQAPSPRTQWGDEGARTAPARTGSVEGAQEEGSVEGAQEEGSETPRGESAQLEGLGGVRPKGVFWNVGAADPLMSGSEGSPPDSPPSPPDTP